MLHIRCRGGTEPRAVYLDPSTTTTKKQKKFRRSIRKYINILKEPKILQLGHQRHFSPREK